jgi:hypothetical protein
MNESEKENDGLFQIEKILDKSYDSKTKQYLYKVKWTGFPEEECTWEPKSNLVLAPKILKEFEKKFEKKSEKGKKKELGKEPKKDKTNLKKNLTKEKKKLTMDKKIDLDITSIYGNINVDVPKKVVGLKKENEELFCLIEWENNDKNKKLNSVVKQSIIREKYPFLLLSFYEQRIKFTNQSCSN